MTIRGQIDVTKVLYGGLILQILLGKLAISELDPPRPPLTSIEFSQFFVAASTFWDQVPQSLLLEVVLVKIRPLICHLIK